ncbi:uncharacterized protein LOC141911637 [Tubulanus polymorphus]|uniref:uncharacterized protein LOC141911637 n=1 Tax=Tubulanus polymorphus TaxID=672921 RepID=UPI003DA31D8F
MPKVRLEKNSIAVPASEQHGRQVSHSKTGSQRHSESKGFMNLIPRDHALTVAAGLVRKVSTVNEQVELREITSETPSGEISDDILENISSDQLGIFGFSCKPPDPLSESGKRKQLMKMLSITLVPTVALVCVITYSLVINTEARITLSSAKNTVEFSIQIGTLLHELQRERDMSAFYLSSIGPNTNQFLHALWASTDAQVATIPNWPENPDLIARPEFKNKYSFIAHLAKHRNEIGRKDLNSSQTITEEIIFYSEIQSVLVHWLYDAIKATGSGLLWRPMVAYQKILASKDECGAERAMGTIFFAMNGFADTDNFTFYMNRYHSYVTFFRGAQNYSSIVTEVSNAITNQSGIDVEKRIKSYRYQIKNRNTTGTSHEMAADWFDDMTEYINALLSMQIKLADVITDAIDQKISSTDRSLVLNCVMIIIALAISPIETKLVVKITNDMQRYALTLADKTRELNEEKKLTDSLLYQMLPRTVAEQLKYHREVNAEYFREATILFTGIAGFNKITAKMVPIEIVGLLGNLYSLLDERIDLYDVYKVETVGDKYMVASGLPQHNGRRHVSEIARMALDVMKVVSEKEFDTSGKLSLRIGIHSGTVVAGVVGTALPRYCLFGDTVNTASRMESQGLPNRIHISARTARMLEKTDMFAVEQRGKTEIKGKGEMVTYWLLKFESQIKLKIGKDSTIELKPECGVQQPIRNFVAQESLTSRSIKTQQSQVSE